MDLIWFGAKLEQPTECPRGLVGLHIPHVEVVLTKMQCFIYTVYHERQALCRAIT